jgi:hypothetical protein
MIRGVCPWTHAYTHSLKLVILSILLSSVFLVDSDLVQFCAKIESIKKSRNEYMLFLFDIDDMGRYFSPTLTTREALLHMVFSTVLSFTRSLDEIPNSNSSSHCGFDPLIHACACLISPFCWQWCFIRQMEVKFLDHDQKNDKIRRKLHKALFFVFATAHLTRVLKKSLTIHVLEV